MKLHHITEQLKEFKQKLSLLKGNTLNKPDLHENDDSEHIVLMKNEHSKSDDSHKIVRTRLTSSLKKPQTKTESIKKEISHKDNKN